MPMPPYLRFPESESLQQRIWGFQPRNPSCGAISLEKGTKIYAWGNIIMYGIAVALISLMLLLLIIGSANQPSHRELIHSLIQGHGNATDDQDDWIEKIHMKQSYAVIIIWLSFALLMCCYFLSVFLKLKKAVVERDVPTLKKCFVILLIVGTIFFLLNFPETEILWSKSFFIELPLVVFDIMGLLFTYFYIVSLINPDYNQSEDMNRIQFNV